MATSGIVALGRPALGFGDEVVQATGERAKTRALTAAASKRFDTIDLLRGYAILGVVLLHVSNLLSYSGQAVGGSLPGWLKYIVFSQGGNGVSAFFAVSGFLITFVSIRRFGKLANLSLRNVLPYPLCQDRALTLSAAGSS